jgi:purine-binding chemotaxis protein CheW
MAFDDDVLSALEEAFGADRASLMDELDLEAGEETSPDASADKSLDDLVSELDLEIVQQASEIPRGEPRQRRSRSLDDKHVLARLGESYYALPMKNVQEIQQLPMVTYLPHLPEWIPGVCNLRGNIVSIVDLKQLLGFEPTNFTAKTRLVVVRTEQQDLTTGLIVDEVVRITEIEAGSIRRPVGPLEGQLSQFLKGTCETHGAVICVMDLETTLNSSPLRLARS